MSSVSLPASVLVLGAGFGGLELSTRVSAACGDAVRVTLIDKAPGFVFGFSELDVMFGKVRGGASDAEYDGFGRCYVEFGQGEIAQVDITFAPGASPHGTFFTPDAALELDKRAFGSERALRWFGQSWQSNS